MRLVWVGDMEFKGDEAHMFHRAEAGHWPWLGLSSGVGLPNPGMSVWVFVALSRLFGLHNPTSLDRGVEGLNIAALLLLLVFVLREVSGREREAWLWGTALVALSPPAILFSRKIWAQSVLPFFSTLLLIAWWRRRNRGAAFAWGVLGAGLGQIHMSGFFFAGGLAAWTALFDRRSARWKPWLLGTLLGSLTLIPWIHDVVGHSGPSDRSLGHIAGLGFWRLWVGHPLALDMHMSFGSHFGSFLASPHIGDAATHGVALCYAVMLACAAFIAVGAVRALWSDRRWRELFVGRETQTSFLLSAGLWGFGLLLTLTAVFIYRHYLIVAFVLPFMWFAWLALMRPRVGRRVLTVLCVAEALLSVQFLAYIHEHHGVRGGDYGISYDAQPRSERGR
jgi:hypothetical protein